MILQRATTLVQFKSQVVDLGTVLVEKYHHHALDNICVSESKRYLWSELDNMCVLTGNCLKIT